MGKATGVPVTFTYDQAGNTLTQKNTTQPFNITLTWDAENRLKTYHQTGTAGGNAFNQRLTHTYNGDGQRVERTAIGGPTNARYVWDRQNIHLKLNTSNALVDHYVYEPREFGNLVATGTTGRTHHYDPLSSTTVLTNTGGGVSEVYSYTPWGEIDAPDPLNAAVNPFLYIGRMGYYCDDEGLNKDSTSPLLPFQVRARFYNPSWGRWLNPDPLGYRAIDSNLYKYVGNNPINLTDSRGLDREMVLDVPFPHTFIRVTVNGVCYELHYNLFGSHILPCRPGRGMGSGTVTETVASTPEEDEALLDQWRNPRRNIYIPLLHDCNAVSMGYVRFGIPNRGPYRGEDRRCVSPWCTIPAANDLGQNPGPLRDPRHSGPFVTQDQLERIRGMQFQ